MPVSETSRVYDMFHFILLLSIDKVGKRPLEVTPMELHLLIWC